MLLPATLIYARRRSLSGALWGMVCGVLLMTVVGLFANLYILLTRIVRLWQENGFSFR